MALRIAALGGFEPSQARPQQAPIDGAALLVQLASVAAWAALDHQLTPDGVALVVLRIAALGGFGPSQARPQQAPLDGGTLVVAMASVAALAALDPQLTPDGVALMALRIAALGGFGPSQARPQQAPLDGAALVALVDLVPARL